MELHNINKQLIDSAREVKNLADELLKMPRAVAEAERDYQVAKSRAIILFKKYNFPVGYSSDIVRGIAPENEAILKEACPRFREPLDNVSDLRFKRDLVVETYRASQKVLGVLSGNMSAYQSILKYSVDV